MKRRVDQDIKSLSDCQANAGAAEYERLMEEIEILRDVRQAEQQMEAGQGLPHVEAKAQIMAALKR